MDQDLIAQASTIINAPRAKVWNALVDPEAIKQYMFGTDAVSDWHKGSKIIWKSEWQSRSYEDNGVILQLKRGRILQYSHFSPLSGVPDTPENYHIVTIELSDENDRTRVLLTQDKNLNEDDRLHSENTWGMMLTALKEYLEQ
jgi:uncharacterized protein YndB with AHSA1/START domain